MTERPVLVRRVVRADGSRTTAFRVFCPRQGRSLDLDTCRACRSCIEITRSCEGDVVRCTPPAAPDDAESVGALLRAPVLAVHADTSLREISRLFVDGQLACVFVVDDGEKVVGVVRDVDLLRAASPSSSNARAVMGTALPVAESTSLRRALLQMAVTHVRQAPIVDADGELLGVLVDIEALRWLAAIKR
jgi:CBS domain-containing protein